MIDSSISIIPRDISKRGRSENGFVYSPSFRTFTQTDTLIRKFNIATEENDKSSILANEYGRSILFL